ncbi:MAG: MFS transporter [Rhodospirillaceae bacterium]|nr:MFS transporter [Rhodospirillaceae bacterium]
MSRKSYIVLVAGCAVLLITMGVRQSFGLFLNPLTQDFQLDFGVFSLTLAIQNLLWGLSQPYIGALADKYGSGRTIAIAGVANVLGMWWLANATSVWEIHMSAGVVIGIAGSGATLAVILGVIARNVPAERRSFFLGIGSAVATMGQITMAPVAQSFITDFGWTTTVIILGLSMGLIVPLAFALTGKASDVSAADEGAEKILDALNRARKHSGYVYLTMGFYVCGFHVAFIMSHFPNYLTSLEMPEWLPGAAISVVGVSNLIGTFGFGWAGDKWSKKYLLSSIYTGRAIVFGVFFLTPLSVTSVLVFSAALGFLWLATVPLTSGLVGQMFGVRYLATLFGIVFASHQLGAFTSSWIGGLVFDETGSYDLIWQISILLGVLTALLHLPIDERPVEMKPQPAE